MKKPNQISPALAMLHLTWNHCERDAWTRINHAMRVAMKHAIGSCFRSDIDDFGKLRQFRSEYWIGDREWCYTQAICDGNASAVAAFEKFQERQPFFANKVRQQYPQGGYMHVPFSERSRERLAMGFGFPHDGRMWWVTGFGDGVVRVAAYKDGRQGKPDRLLKLTHEDLRAICPAPKKVKRKERP